jgi:hypothetical protein
MGKFKNQHSRTCAVLLLWLGCTLSGCQAKQQYQDQLTTYSSAFLSQLDEKYQRGQKDASQSDEAKQHNLSVQQALILAAKNDEEVLAFLAEMRKAKIDVTDALSHRWPRLDLRAQAEIPTGGTHDNIDEFTGGAYFKYDILKAVAVGDEHALRQALVSREFEKLKIVLNGLMKKVLHQLTQISFLQYKIERRTDTLNKAKSAYAIAKIYTQNSETNGTLLQTWKSKIDTLSFDLKKSQQELQAAQITLAHMMGLMNAQDITLTDRQEILAPYSSMADTIPAPSEIWSKHSEARIAEAEYIASEVNVKLAQIEGWPRLQTTLGLGNVPFASSGETTETLFKLSVEYPLLDLGDTSRKVKKAEITRDLAQLRLSKKAFELVGRAQEAGGIFHAAKENYNDLDASCAEINERLQSGKILLAQSRLNALEFALAELDVAEAEIMRREALAKVEEAGGDFRFSIGEDVIAGMSPVLLKNLVDEQKSNGGAEASIEINNKTDRLDTIKDEVK